MQTMNGINKNILHSEYTNYLNKHLTEPFVMLDEINLSYEDFEQLFNNSYSFREMWKIDECNYTYYEIRGGRCQYAKVYNGKIHCSKCKT
jgi:hypothetical protein